MLSLVLPVWKEAPQVQVTVIELYLGWMLDFIGGILAQVLVFANLPAGRQGFGAEYTVGDKDNGDNGEGGGDFAQE